MDNKIGIPGAIILAGILIAGAVIYSNVEPKAPVAEEIKNEELALGDELYKEKAKEFGISEEDFNTCFSSDKAFEKVKEDLAEGILISGERGPATPLSIIVAPDGRIVRVVGVQQVAQIEEALERVRSEDPQILLGAPEGFRQPNEEDHVFGNKEAPISIVEFSDFQCPFCARLHPVLEQVIERNEDVKWIYRHLPLSSIHPEAAPSAIASECIAELAGNDAFWSFANSLFEVTGS